MADIVFVAIVIAFFSLAVLLVRACERIIGSEDAVETSTSQPVPEHEVAA